LRQIHSPICRGVGVLNKVGWRGREKTSDGVRTHSLGGGYLLLFHLKAGFRRNAFSFVDVCVNVCGPGGAMFAGFVCESVRACVREFLTTFPAGVYLVRTPCYRVAIDKHLLVLKRH
jgi:hypothetical protein